MVHKLQQCDVLYAFASSNWLYFVYISLSSSNEFVIVTF